MLYVYVFSSRTTLPHAIRTMYVLYVLIVYHGMYQYLCAQCTYAGMHVCTYLGLYGLCVSIGMNLCICVLVVVVVVVT